jgi:hypothetical protein
MESAARFNWSKEVVIPRELTRRCAHLVCEIDTLQVDKRFSNENATAAFCGLGVNMILRLSAGAG